MSIQKAVDWVSGLFGNRLAAPREVRVCEVCGTRLGWLGGFDFYEIPLCEEHFDQVRGQVDFVEAKIEGDADSTAPGPYEIAAAAVVCVREAIQQA